MAGAGFDIQEVALHARDALIAPVARSPAPSVDADSELLSLRFGLRRLIKRELLDATRREALLASDALREAAAEVFLATPGGAGSSTVFASPDAPLLETARELETLERRSGAARARAIRWFGEQLGYPPCCVERFSALRTQDDEAVLTGLLSRERWNPIGHEMNFLVPAMGPVTHYPCALDCAASLARGRRFLSRLAEARPELHAAWLPVLRAPMLLLDRFRLVIFVGGQLQGDELRYERPFFPHQASSDPVFTRPEASRLFLARLAPLFAASNRLRFDGLAIHLWRGEDPIASLRFGATLPWRILPA